MPASSLVALRKCSIANLRTAEVLEAQFNPTDFERTIAVNWAHITVPGLSHEVLQYTNTKNTGFSFEFFCLANTTDSRARTVDFMNFIESLCYASAGANSIRNGAPPRVLVVWPSLLSMTCVVGKVGFGYKAFTSNGLEVTRAMVSIDFEEIRDARLTSEDVRARGGLRGSASSGSAPTGASDLDSRLDTGLGSNIGRG